MTRRTTLRTLQMFLVLAAILTTVAACSSRSRSPAMARVDDEAIRAAQSPVNILDHDLRNRVAADMADAVRLPDGRLQVRANLRNSTRDNLRVEVRCVFKDEAGMSVGDETQWSMVFFSPQQIQTFGATSRTPQASSFTLEVRRP